MKSMVVGGSGFVGSHVADALQKSGDEVTVFDIKPSEHLLPGQKFIQGDLLDARAVDEAIRGHEVVYNFAGMADIEQGLVRPLETVNLNVLGNVTLLEACRKSEVRRYLFASTIYVSGNSGGFYRVSKQACELYVQEYQRLFGLDYTILRYGSLYGRRADSNNGVYRYLQQALKDRRIVCSGTGEEVREYIHVEDAARAALTVLSEDFRNQHVMLTGHQPMKVKDLLIMIKEIVGPDVAIVLQSEDSLKEPTSSNLHYSVTPYSFNKPQIARKLISNFYLDMGQGLLDCLDEIHVLSQNR